MYGKSSMEAYITICKIGSQGDEVGNRREVPMGGDICIPMPGSC